MLQACPHAASDWRDSIVDVEPLYLFIASPQGEILTAADGQTAVLISRLDLSRIAGLREQWPFFRYRRIYACQDLLKRLCDWQRTGVQHGVFMDNDASAIALTDKQHSGPRA